MVGHCFFFILCLCFVLLLLANRKYQQKQKDDLIIRNEMLFDHIIINSELAFYWNLSDVIQDRNVLFYRFSDDMCENCVYEDLTNLRWFQNLVGVENLVLLPAYPNDKNSQIRLASELTGLRYKNISEEILPFPIERHTGMKVRYMGYINEKGVMEMFFIPLKGEIELTREYLSRLRTNKFIN